MCQTRSPLSLKLKNFLTSNQTSTSKKVFPYSGIGIKGIMKSLKFKPYIAVVGLGYVGLPVAVAFNKAGVPTIGFDVNETKIEELKEHVDRTDELSQDELQAAKTITYTANPKELTKANFIVVAVPTPITK